MKKLILSIAILSIPLLTNANQYYPNYSNGFNTPNFNNGSSWNMPKFNWGNNNGGSNWSMPSMNWGNGNGYNNGSNWNMPNFNWGNNNSRGNNWSMPSMNWGNSNGYNNGSNWNMPNFNWSNGNNGSNWNMPNMNWGNSQNNIQPWNYNNSYGYRVAPQPSYRVPVAPIPLQKPRMQAPSQPKIPTQIQSTNQKLKPAIEAAKKNITAKIEKIPTPDEVKNVLKDKIPEAIEAIKTPVAK